MDKLRSQLNEFHYALAVLILIICGLIFVSYGWIFFATITSRPGLNGDVHYYYRNDKILFAIYQLLIAAAALLTIIRLSLFVYHDNKPRVTKTFIHFAIFIGLIIICELYLSTRFVGKG
jgi:hypothetical protein